MLSDNLAPKQQSFEISFVPDHGFMKVDFYGDIHFKDIIDSLSAVIRHNEFRFNMPACYDFTNALVDIDINMIEIIYHFLVGLSDKRGNQYPLALVYSDEMTKTLFNFYRLFFSRSKIDIESFKNKDTALEWISTSLMESSVSYL